MTTILLVIHLLVALALVGVILIQRSEGGALGSMGGAGAGGGFGGLMTGRGSANLLTRTTAVLAAAFIATSMLLAIFASRAQGPASILDTPPPAAAPVEAPVEEAPPAAPAAPLAD